MRVLFGHPGQTKVYLKILLWTTSKANSRKHNTQAVAEQRVPMLIVPPTPANRNEHKTSMENIIIDHMMNAQSDTI